MTLQHFLRSHALPQQHMTLWRWLFHTLQPCRARTKLLKCEHSFCSLYLSFQHHFSAFCKQGLGWHQCSNHCANPSPLKEQAELMHQAKFDVGVSSSKEQGSSEHVGPSQSAKDPGESLQLPRLTKVSDVDGLSADTECSNDDPEVSTTTMLLEEGVKWWLPLASVDMKKIMAMTMYDHFVSVWPVQFSCSSESRTSYGH